MKRYLEFINENNSITLLNCSYNKLEELPELSNSLEILWCDNNKLKILPELPNSLEELYCYNNILKKLPELPNSLKILHCDNNELKKLPELPNSLEILWCNNNSLEELPELPDSLVKLECYNNPFIEPLSVEIHKKFELKKLYSKELIDKFSSYKFQDEYISTKREYFERLDVFGYAPGIKEKYSYIFKSKRSGII